MESVGNMSLSPLFLKRKNVFVFRLALPFSKGKEKTKYQVG
jgi:hypothetical protein